MLKDVVSIDNEALFSDGLDPLSLLLIIVVLIICILAGYFITKKLKK